MKIPVTMLAMVGGAYLSNLWLDISFNPPAEFTLKSVVDILVFAPLLVLFSSILYRFWKEN